MTETKQAAAAVRAAALPAPCVIVLADGRLAAASLLERLAPFLAAELPGAQTALRPNGGDRLTGIAEQVLALLASPGSDAPSPSAGPARGADLETLMAEACTAFDERYPDRNRPVVWADERLAELLPFWRRALAGSRRLVGLLVPTALGSAAISLQGRAGGAATALAELARRERWLRAALAGLDGLPVYVARDDRLDEQPGAELLAFFAEQGVPLRRGAAPPPVAGPARRGAARGGDEIPDGRPASGNGGAGSQLLLPEMRELDAECRRLSGPHARFAPAPGAPSAWSSALLELADELEAALRGLGWAAAQLEPLLAVGEGGEAGEQLVEKVASPDGEDHSTPEDGGAYPLNAAEDRVAYHRWLRSRGRPTNIGAGGSPPRPPRPPRTPAPTRPPGQRPRISVLVPVFRPPLWALERCVASVLDQDLADWELVLCDDGSGDPGLGAYLAGLPGRDPRIKVAARPESGGISAATNAALSIAEGDLVAFLDHDDELTPHALSTVNHFAVTEPDADVIYSDEDKVDDSGELFDPFFKPDWSPDLLLSYAYVAHLTAIRRELVDDLGGLRPAFDGSQDWDLVIRASERARRVVHVADVLYHWRVLPTSAASGSDAKPWAFEAGLRVLEDTLARRGEHGEVTQEARFPGRYHVRRRPTARPLVSIVIPFRDEPALLATAARSLRAAPGYDNFELVLVDNGSELPETAELVEQLASGPGVRVVPAPGPFNWPAINNAAARQAAGDVLLFLNNDIEARVPRWLDALLGQALRPEVGAVGGRLIYPDRTVQHIGVVLGLGGIAGHVLKNLPADRPGYASMAIQARNCTVVTGACMMVRREVFESVGGFDERLPVAFNDVDFCLKLREKGFLVVYEPLAELVHHESKTRGHTDDLVEGRRIIERWGPTIGAGDPYLNEHLSHWRYWCALSTPQEEERWTIYVQRHASTPSSSSST